MSLQKKTKAQLETKTGLVEGLYYMSIFDAWQGYQYASGLGYLNYLREYTDQRCVKYCNFTLIPGIGNFFLLISAPNILVTLRYFMQYNKILYS